MSLVRQIPNTLTVLRILLSVPVAFYLWHGRIAVALAFLVCAAVSDLLDGFLAREFGWRTVLGSWLDPAADKTVITTCLITLTARGDLPLWFCVLTMLRDLQLLAGVLSLRLRGIIAVIQPRLSGKLATMAQNTVLLVAMLKSLQPQAGSLLPGVLACSAVLTVISAVSYGSLYSRKYGKSVL